MGVSCRGYLCSLIKQDVDAVAQELEEGDESAVVHIPSGAKFQILLPSEVHVTQHQCQAPRPRLQPIGLGKGGQSDQETATGLPT